MPEHENFGWALRLQLAPHSSVTVPVRVQTRDRGWTQYFFADLDSLSQAQLDQLAANDLFEPAQDAV
ncbi:hypothetical protein U91I_04147 [alpha proteobacterium U9-1i]|nr:hypothetical protein U91I_04147 [alpha proteobacterium U9-1i]